MIQPTTQIPVSLIILDEAIYPRKGIDHRRVAMFAENIRDGVAFDPIEVEPCPDKPGFYRLLDGAHRWHAYKSTGVEEINAIIKDLDGNDPLLYAAAKAIGPKQLTEQEARDTARRAYSRNTHLNTDPMAGGGVTPDTCLAMGRRCWAFDMKDRPETRPEIEPFTWNMSSDQGLSWPVTAKEKSDLIIFDPPYFDKKAADYDEKSISGLSKKDYLEFLAAFFVLLKHHVKNKTRLAFINADWRDFQSGLPEKIMKYNMV